METRIFSYPWSIKALKWFFILGGVIFLANMIRLIISMFKLADSIAGKSDNAFVPVIIVLLIAIVFSYVCILGFDRFPEIIIGNDGITIQYLLNRIHVPWVDILHIESLMTPWLSKRKDKFVLKKSFPFYYRVSNIFLHGLFKPGFIINGSIIDYERLSVSIQNHTSTH
jgi:hypothetical protein